MLKKKFAAAGIAVAAVFSLAACGGEDVDGTWKAKDETVEIKDGEFTVTGTKAGEEFTFGGDVDYENEKLVFTAEDLLKGIGEDLSEEELQQAKEELEDPNSNGPSLDPIDYSVDGDTLTIDGDKYTRED